MKPSHFQCGCAPQSISPSPVAMLSWRSDLTRKTSASQGHRFVAHSVEDAGGLIARSLNEDYGIDLEITLDAPEVVGRMLASVGATDARRKRINLAALIVAMRIACGCMKKRLDNKAEITV